MGHHGPELVEGETLAVFADPRLAEQHRAVIAEPDRDRDDREQGHEQEQRQGGAGLVEHALDGLLGPGQLRVVHVQQRQPGHGADGGPRAGHIEQGGRDEQVGAGLLEFPRQLAQAAAVHLGAGQHRDGIRAKPAHGRRDVAQAAGHRYVGREQVVGGHASHGRASRAIRPGTLRRVDQAGGDHRQAVVGVAAQHGDQASHCCRMAHRDDSPQTPALDAPFVQALAEQVPGRQVHDGRGRQGDRHVPTGQIELGRVGDNGHTRGQVDRRAEDPAELIGAEPDEPGVIAAGQQYRHPPRDGQPAGEAQVGEGQVGLVPETDPGRRHAGRQGAGPVGQRSSAKVGDRPRLRARDGGIPADRYATVRPDRIVGYAHAANCPPASFSRSPAIRRRTRKARSVNGMVPLRI
jgi:hypothetical protein